MPEILLKANYDSFNSISRKQASLAFRLPRLGQKDAFSFWGAIMGFYAVDPAAVKTYVLQNTYRLQVSLGKRDAPDEFDSGRLLCHYMHDNANYGAVTMGSMPDVKRVELLRDDPVSTEWLTLHVDFAKGSPLYRSRLFARLSYDIVQVTTLEKIIYTVT